MVRVIIKKKQEYIKCYSCKNKKNYFDFYKYHIDLSKFLCKSCISIKRKKFYLKNKTKIKNNYQKNKKKFEEYYEKNKDRIKERVKKWKTDNADKVRIHKRKQRLKSNSDINKYKPLW